MAGQLASGCCGNRIFVHEMAEGGAWSSDAQPYTGHTGTHRANLTAYMTVHHIARVYHVVRCSTLSPTTMYVGTIGVLRAQTSWSRDPIMYLPTHVVKRLDEKERRQLISNTDKHRYCMKCSPHLEVHFRAESVSQLVRSALARQVSVAFELGSRLRLRDQLTHLLVNVVLLTSHNCKQASQHDASLCHALSVVRLWSVVLVLGLLSCACFTDALNI